jgi:hypothetical protein
MKGCVVALGILAGLVVLIVGYFWLSFYFIHVRYRLTVEVQDGDQIKTGSSVIDVSYNIEPDWSPSHFNSHPTTVGYAPTVDLGEKGMLFVTFFNARRTSAQQVERNRQVFCLFEDIGCLPFAAYHKSSGSTNMSEKKAALYELLRQSGPRAVPFIVLPKLARFRDASDRHKLVPVSPDDLAASFGSGVQLKRVILQLTDDPVTPQPQIWPLWTTAERQNSGLSGYEKN